MSDLVVNGRFIRQRQAGVQRVAAEISKRLKTPHIVLQPRRSGSGAAGHVWEQLVLPARAQDRLIWGPCNTGPIAAKNQILTIHGTTVFDHPEWFSRGFVRLHQTLWPVLAKRARRIVTVSHYSRRRISEVLKLPAERIEVVWNGVSESFKPASETAIAAARKYVGISDAGYFVTLSTIEPRKNLSLVLRSWERAYRKLPAGTSLLIVGSTGSVAVFGRNNEVTSNNLTGVVLTGYVPEEHLPPLLSGALGVLYPSLYEGFGLPVLEGMACGVPVVTTRLTSLPEVGGDSALYVDPHDPDGLAGVLVALASSSDLRRERGASGIARAQLFGWNTAAARMDEIFRACL